MKRAFAKMAMECGIPRHKTAHNRTFYFLDEVEDALRGLDG